ncbi:MAG: DnaD domain protein [Clostridium sp.]|nr:DnaD domain protein [Clostridium sp.]
MGGNLKDRWSVPVTAVANEFIDQYMAGANGEYVKVYLFILRHQDVRLTVDMIADGLNHTESDVRRALSYWQRLGVISEKPGEERDCERSAKERPGQGPARDRSREPEDGNGIAKTAAGDRTGEAAAQDAPLGNVTGRSQMGERSLELWPPEPAGGHRASRQEMAAAGGQAALEAGERKELSEAPPKKSAYSQEAVNRLAQDEEFSQLLYIAQKYMNRVFTPRDCQVFAYLYEDLGMKGELLEYLVEYCVQNGHSSVRYIEAVALNWHEKGLRTVREAKAYSSSYNQDSFAVMKAFGLNNRKPGLPEQKLMDKWFKEYGFSRELVLEACSRTITAIHNPSFQYADKILSDWKAAGVKGMADVEALDAKRTAGKEEGGPGGGKRPSLQEENKAASPQGNRTRKGAPNQFHNFEQRDTDYDALMLKQVREWVGQQS